MESKTETAPMVEIVPPVEITLEKMELVDRIELLNVLRSIRETLPKVKKISPQIERYIHKQYLDWVDGNIRSVLGEPKKSDTFSDQEVHILKALASKVQQKQDAPVMVAPQPQIASQNQQLQQPLTKLKETVDVAKYRKSQEEFLKQLEAMDRNSPDF